MKKLNIAIIGQGRSGRDIHGRYFKSEANTLFNVVVVVEYDAKIIMTAPDKPVIDIEINSNDAYSAPTFKILGSKGTYKSTPSEYEMKYIVDGENPEQKLILESLQNAEGLPSYCSEKLITHEEKGEVKGTAFDVGTAQFYEMMYNGIVNGEEMSIKPENAAMVISVIEQVHAENPLIVKF